MRIKNQINAKTLLRPNDLTNLKKEKQKYSEKDDDNSSFSSASISFATENNNNNNSINSLQNSFKIKKQYSKKSLQYSVTFKTNSFKQKEEKNKKNSMQLISKLFSFIRNKLIKCSISSDYALKNQINNIIEEKNKNIPNRGRKKRKSSIRKPKLLGMRQRKSLNFNKSENQKQIFERLLILYTTPNDVIKLKNNPEILIQFGIDSKQFSSILEELYFFLQKSEQLKEAEQRINKRKKKN